MGLPPRERKRAEWVGEQQRLLVVDITARPDLENVDDLAAFRQIGDAENDPQ
jgi:hypothetical protein